VRALERAASDLADSSRTQKPSTGEKTGKNIAIIGSGPAGMTCAYFSALLGHNVLVFEASHALGGIPRLCIPPHRLPKDILEREIGEVLSLGIRARLNTKVGKDISFAEIMEGHDACLIATGAWKEKSLRIPGIQLAESALTFLSSVNRGERPKMGGKVVILGGGGVAFDCASTAQRLGASDVTIVCLESREKMVAPPDDIVQAEAEGIILDNLKTFSRILITDQRVTGIECSDIRSFKFNQAGEVETEIVPASKHILPADTIILALGEVPDLSFVNDVEGLVLDDLGAPRVDPMTLMTSLPGIFAAGDVITSYRSIAHAIGEGRRAAVGMDCYLTGKKMEEVASVSFEPNGYIVTRHYDSGEYKEESPHVVMYDEIHNLDYYQKATRVQMPQIASSEAVKSHKEVNQGYRKEDAIQEAGRCFHCGHCAMCGTCVQICPLDVLTMGADGPEVAYPDECWHCGNCRINCPCSAVYYEFPLSMLI
jgi:NADPH-dependent glutamate synthase beta subunit-like oxidoreductase